MIGTYPSIFHIFYWLILAISHSRDLKFLYMWKLKCGTIKSLDQVHRGKMSQDMNSRLSSLGLLYHCSVAQRYM